MEHPPPDDRAARVRLFVALELPDAVRTAIATWGKRAFGSDDRLRLVGADALHVTLAFLGWRDPDTTARIADVALGGVSDLPLPLLTPIATAGLPVRRPRVVALDLHDRHDGATAIQSHVVERLTGAALYEPERRTFRPHLTVARVRGKANVRLGALPDPPDEPLRPAGVVLYRSDLSPGGARYTPLIRAPLARRDA
jgi:2'-5' RNA ligase